MPQPLLEVKDLCINFSTKDGSVRAVRDVNFKIQEGETFGLAGESGSGKSTIAYAIMRYLASNGEITRGEVLFKGKNLLVEKTNELRTVWGNEIAMVYQDPKTSLNPSIRVGEQIGEVLQIHRELTERKSLEESLRLLELVNISDPPFNARKYPHQLSGGMQQRIIIAMALACDPALLIMDEPTTGLDVTTQAKIIDLIEDLKSKVKASILYITHDLSVIAQVSDLVGIIYAGEMVETGPVEKVFHNPSHPYTIGLLKAIPDVELSKPFRPIKGRLPDTTKEIKSCVFASRCDLKISKCEIEKPQHFAVENRHHSKCHRWKEAPKLYKEELATWRKRAGLATGRKLVKLDHIKKYYGHPRLLDKLMGIEPSIVKAVDDISFEVMHDEIFALVGESGCGKTTLARCLVKILDLTDGKITFCYANDEAAAGKGVRDLLRSVQMIFQHPDSSLNPFKSIGAILNRPLKLYGLPRRKRRRRIYELLEAVKLDESYTSRFPKELSGGEKQRIAIARAFAANPDFVILDEPVSALDVSIQAAIIDLLLEFKSQLKVTFLFISHDLSLVRHVADKAGVMYLGKLCELGDIESIFSPPYHPYTKALLSAIPHPDPSKPKSLIRLEGSIPSAKNPPNGCRFHTRCPSKVGEVCERIEPALLQVGQTHYIACHIPVEILGSDGRII